MRISDKAYYRCIQIIAGIILGVCIFLLIPGCKMGEVAATKKLAKIDLQQPQVQAKFCASKYPPVIYDSTRFYYIQGEDIVQFDTILVDCDTVKVTKVIKTPIKVKVRVDTIRSVQVKTVENKAAIIGLQDDLTKMEQKYKKAEEGKGLAQIWAFLGWAIIIAYVLGSLIKWKIGRKVNNDEILGV